MAKIHFKFLVAFICALMMSILTQTSFAQGPTSQDVDRASLLQGQTQPSFGTSPTPEGFEDGHAAATPNDADIGQQEILKRETQYQPFTVSLASPIFYTSNVALTRRGEMSDVVIAPTAAAYYQPRITKTLYANVDAREQVFYYGSNHAFDFGSLDVEAGLNYFMPQFHNLILRGEYDFNRLTFDDRLGDEFFSNHALILNAELPFRFSRAQQLSVGVDTNISLGADHQSPRRNDYEGYVSYSVSLTRAFTINAVGRVVARDYHQNGRTDVSEIISATATYRLTNWCSISAMSSFAHNDSNQGVFDYNVANAGGAIALQAKF
ncbi:MAG TPA: outer membrane beta-barrel protein [Chthoniobacterales bacterium]|nr:outer membrane beta-barrel protein [Chthoniobacterales bacterium]